MEESRRYLRLFNEGFYQPAKKSNLEADEDAYALFPAGLSHDLDKLTRQLLFIGKDFGGAKVIRFEPVSRAIARQMLGLGQDYLDLITSQPSMEIGTLKRGIAEKAIAPFVDLPEDVGRKRNFPVWASKVLHFSRRDTFPILDRLARNALGFPALIQYPAYVTRYRSVFLGAVKNLLALSAEDPASPTLLRRFDKILYQYGLALKGRNGCQ